MAYEETNSGLCQMTSKEVKTQAIVSRLSPETIESKIGNFTKSCANMIPEVLDKSSTNNMNNI